MNEEWIVKAKAAKSAEELSTLAKENGVELTEEQAQAYYGHFHSSGEVSDEELDNVAGGGCHTKDGRLVVTVGYSCSHWECKCGNSAYRLIGGSSFASYVCTNCGDQANCNHCKWCVYEGALWKCNNPLNRK